MKNFTVGDLIHSNSILFRYGHVVAWVDKHEYETDDEDRVIHVLPVDPYPTTNLIARYRSQCGHAIMTFAGPRVL